MMSNTDRVISRLHSDVLELLKYDTRNYPDHLIFIICGQLSVLRALDIISEQTYDFYHEIISPIC